MLLRNKIIFIIIFVLLAIPVISDNRYEQVGTVLQCLKRSLYDFLINPNSPEVRPKEEIIDLINFYLGINSTVITVDVSVQAPEPPPRQTTKTIMEILGSIPNCEFPAMCSDGTKFAECSVGNYPKYCYAGELIDKCTECGCNAGDYCNTATYQCQSSSDYIKCSVQYGGICSSSDYIERRYCIGNDVYRNYTKAVCINPNTPSSYCGNETIPVLLETCDEGCADGNCLPFLPIQTCQDLQNMQNDLDGYYKLLNDIDCTGFTFESVGHDWDNPFTGTLDGNDKTISNLRNTNYGVGLFGVLDEGASVYNLKLENVDMSGSGGPAGAVVALIRDGTIDTVTSSGNVRINYIGGVGGLVGQMEKGSIIDSSSSVVVEGGSNAGGILGASFVFGGTNIINSHSTGDVNGFTNVGGLVGWAERLNIDNSYSTSNVDGMNGPNVGGLVGYSMQTYITNSYSTGTVTGTGDEVGGLIGGNYYTSITNSYSEGAVTGNNRVGGLIGYTVYSPSITNSYSTGAVSGNEMVGGLVGWAETSKIIESYSTSSVTGTGATKKQIGGLIGYIGTYTEITKSYSTGAVSGNELVGGLVGYADNSEITDSYSISNVVGNIDAGGLIGKSISNTQITNTYSTGGVTGSESNTGGLVGSAQNSGITNSYSTSNVIGLLRVGGLLGRNLGDTLITNSYFTDDNNNDLGTFVSTPPAPDTFYDPTHAVYTADPIWDFTNIWQTTATYPTLK